MKKILLLSVLTFFIFACSKQTKSEVKINPSDSTKIQFSETSFNFGTLKQGEKVEHTFIFKNIGKEPLVISEVHTSCGCTVADYTEKPVNPGSQGYVKVTFNSAGKHGQQFKTIIIKANTKPEKTMLVITGTVDTTSEN
jgi:hypothetical protein